MKLRNTVGSLAAAACLIGSSAFAGTIGDNLLAYWNFDEGTGTAVADSTGNANGTLTGAATWATGADAVYGGAIRYDGSTGSVQLPATGPLVTPDATAMTFSVWVKCDELITSMPVSYRSVFNSNSGQDFYILYYDKGNAQVRFKVSSQNTTVNGGISRAVYASPIANPTMLADTWYHIGCVYDGVDAFLYVNGVLVNTASGVNKGAQGILKNGQISAIASKGTANGQNWKGAMDDLAIWKRALDAGEISFLATCGKPVGQVLTVNSAVADWSIY